jgi:hypothetical protein
MRLVVRCGAAVFGSAALLGAAASRADHLDQTTYESRTVLYYKVDDANLQKLLPAGWKPITFDSGPAKGANLVINISEQFAALGTDGKAAGDRRGRGVTLSARVADPATGTPRAMVMFGFSTGVDVPGPYGTHQRGLIYMTRSARSDSSETLVEESWRAVDAAGDEMKLDFAYARGSTALSHVDQQTRSSVHPDFYRIYKIDAVADVVRSENLNIDHLRRFSFTATGRVSELADDTKQLIAIVSVPIYERHIWLPE